jgi:hypothetical protein
VATCQAKARGRYLANLLILFALASICQAKEKQFIARINGELWAIKFQKEIPGNNSGWTICKSREILVSSDIEREEKAGVILHEVQHAFACESGELDNTKFNNSSGDEHPGIYWAAPKWTKFIQENHELIRWIQDSQPAKVEIIQVPVFERMGVRNR